MQQTLVVVESIMDRRGVDAADIVRRFLAMWRCSELYGYGTAFR